jgi:hypothetical protein
MAATVQPVAFAGNDPRMGGTELPPGGAERRATALVGLAVVAILVTSLGFGISPLPGTMLLSAGLVLVAIHKWLLEWRTMIGLLIAVILFIPIRRYQLPAGLPFHLEPYRITVALITVIWVACLLVQRECRLRRTGFEAPMGAFALTLLLGVAANSGHITALDLNQEVLKKCTFFLSFFIVTWLVASVTVRRSDVDSMVRLLVNGGAIVAFAAIVESRTHFNAFNHLQQICPILHFDVLQTPMFTGERGGRLRAYASAQHSISLGAALVMLVPLAVYVAMRQRTAFSWVVVAILAMGTFTTVSRTAMIMMLVELVVIARAKPQIIRKAWPLALPMLVAIHVALPGTIGAFKDAFHPKGGLVAEQSSGAGTYGSGRLADLGPGLRDWSKTPFLGQGFGTRITDQVDPKWNAPILDDEWLATLLETGAAGVLSLLWLFARAFRRLKRAAKRDDGERGWLLAGLAAAVCAFPVGMMTYDAFSFIQVTFLFFILLGIAAAELRLGQAVVPEDEANVIADARRAAIRQRAMGAPAVPAT